MKAVRRLALSSSPSLESIAYTDAFLFWQVRDDRFVIALHGDIFCSKLFDKACLTGGPFPPPSASLHVLLLLQRLRLLFKQPVSSVTSECQRQLSGLFQCASSDPMTPTLETTYEEPARMERYHILRPRWSPVFSTRCLLVLGSTSFWSSTLLTWASLISGLRVHRVADAA
jgi:hypothetical protein